MHLWLIQTRVQGLQIDLFKISRHLCFKNGINTVSWCLVFLSEAKKRHLLLTCPFQSLTCSICSGWRYLENLYSQTETVNEVHPLVCIPSFVLPNVSSPHNKPLLLLWQSCKVCGISTESFSAVVLLFWCCGEGKKIPSRCWTCLHLAGWSFGCAKKTRVKPEDREESQMGLNAWLLRALTVWCWI